MPAIPAPFHPGDQCYLLEFPYLLPAYTHPASQRIARDRESWIRAKMPFALPDDNEINRLIEERASLWTCYVLPTAAEERLSTLCEYTEYLSVFDNSMVDREKIGRDVEAAKELFNRVANILVDQAVGPDFEWTYAATRATPCTPSWSTTSIPSPRRSPIGGWSPITRRITPTAHAR